MREWRGGRLGRSIAAISAGFVVTAALSIAADAAMRASGVFPPWGVPMSDSLFGWAATYRAAVAIIGSYLTARLAPARPAAHAIVLGGIGMLVATAGAAATWSAGPEFGPHWYALALIAMAMPCAMAGAALRRVETRRKS